MPLIRLITRLLRCDRGISAVEYGFLCCLIVVAMVGALNGMARVITGTWNNVSSQVETAISNSHN
ncbi:MAG TPA: Flp family type IVb pilin [Novosphingobium sp.]|nr:Flp family type IVb pilin [Novosphingobium sp.]